MTKIRYSRDFRNKILKSIDMNKLCMELATHVKTCLDPFSDMGAEIFWYVVEISKDDTVSGRTESAVIRLMYDNVYDENGEFDHGTLVEIMVDPRE